MLALVWVPLAKKTYDELRDGALKSQQNRKMSGKTKASKVEGLFKQVNNSLKLLRSNPRHPGLATHEYASMENPYDSGGKVFVAYVQQNTPAAYRLFWCYGPAKGHITILALTPHP